MQEHLGAVHRPKTLEQRLAFIAAYRRTTNVTAAMQEAGIRGYDTAYRWLRRYREWGEAALESRPHARETSSRIPTGIAAKICHLRNENPYWGRRRIAAELRVKYGHRVSAAGVEAVLRRAGLWESTASRLALRKATVVPVLTEAWRVDTYELLERIRDGIWFDIHSQAVAAVTVLRRAVWSILPSETVKELLRSDKLGPWFIASRAYLAHSLMNTGQWEDARRCILETVSWLTEEERWRSNRARQAVWEEQADFTRLPRDDIWLGCYLSMGTMLQDDDPERGLEYVRQAESKISTPQASDRLVTANWPLTWGNLQRHLAKLKRLANRYDVHEIERHLRVSQENLEQAQSPGMLAATQIEWARFYARQGKYSDMEEAVEQALALVEVDSSPMLRTNFFIDAAQLYLQRGLPLDRERLRRAAEYCLAHGFGREARQLLALKGVENLLAEDVVDAIKSFLGRPPCTP